ncbi:hypothetical protein [Salegentibacter sp. F14]
MKILLFSLLIFLSFQGLNAQNLNNYKYIIIPESFEFSKEKNQYQLNSLLKFLFEREGFETLMDKANRPVDLQRDPCLGLDADVTDDSGLFTTRMKINLEDCRGNLIFTSEEGTSREKDYRTAWHESLREAFKSVEGLNYNYEGNAATETPTVMVVGQAPVEALRKEKQSPEPSFELKTGNTKEKTLKNEYLKRFEKEGAHFILKENENGFALYQQDMDEPFALLIRSQEAGSFIYNSVTKQGIATFSSTGDLVVEHFDASKGVSIKTLYSLVKD